MTINIVKLHAAAFYFVAYSRRASDIAAHVGVHTRTIKRWAETDAWALALDTLGYTGAREFVSEKTRDAARDQGVVYDHAKSVYVGFLRDGTPPHKLVSLTSEVVNRPKVTIRRWAKAGNWEDPSIIGQDPK